MSKKQYDIIYFHGLDSSLNEEKRKALEGYGSVIAPTYDYRNPVVLENIEKTFKFSNNTVLAGSSFGGYLANLFSTKYDIPCLLFNPALAVQSIAGLTKLDNKRESKNNNLSYFVLGKQDTVVSAEASLLYIDKYIKGTKVITIEPNLEHRVPPDIFEKHLYLFFNMLNELSLKI